MIRSRSIVMGLLAAALVLASALAVAGCGSPGGTAGQSAGQTAGKSVLAETSFLADIAQNVAGGRLTVSSIVPIGSDPHGFEPTPQHAAKIASAAAVVINSPGLEPSVDKLIGGAGGKGLLVIDASQGLPGAKTDPHFWLDPSEVVTYVDNIRAGLAKIDPAGADRFAVNAATYQTKLKELDVWISQRVAVIPPARRLLVTNHESFGRFATRYGFTIVGTILPSADTESAPSAQQLAQLAGAIRSTGAPAIFLETGNNPDLADQLARETGIKVITDLYTHSLGPNAMTYIDMMHWNVDRIVEALQ
jgi:ABC-type Zn uptake system ZnuABC Zn-binding protein ZnuA